MYVYQEHAIADAWRIRAIIARIFADDTRAPKRATLPPSTGHCAVSALLVRELMGADVRAITHPGAGAHWFGSLSGRVGDRGWGLFVDLTLDQFFLPDRLMVSEIDPWPDLAHRNPGEPGGGLRARFELFRERFWEEERRSCRRCGKANPPGGHVFCSVACQLLAGEGSKSWKNREPI